MFASRVSRRIVVTRPPKKLLRPYELALQLKQLSANVNVDAAVQRLRSVPRDAQNVPAWNTMLSLCMAHKKFQLAYTLFTDMKRRGFSPNISTFTTMLKGLSQISDWSNHPKQLANAHALYRYYHEYTQSVKHHDPDNTAQLSLSPLVIYISVLGAAGDIQKIFDIYFSMDQDGALAPDRFVFTAMLRAVSNHQERAGAVSAGDAAGSDAKYVWLQIEKTIRKRPDFEIDSRLIAAALAALARGRPADQSLALDIAARHLGLTRPDHPGPSTLSSHLNSWTLDAVLQVCFAMQEFGLCVHFMRLVMDHVDSDPPGVPPFLARAHIHKLLRAHTYLATSASPRESSQALDALEWCLKNDAAYGIPDLRPNMRTYHLVLMTCLRTGDWQGALKSFQAMTSDGTASSTGRQRAEGRTLVPNAETMSFIVRTALQTKENAKSLHAFQLCEQVGIDKLLEGEGADPYHRASFARALATVVDQLLDHPTTGHRREWLLSLKTRALQVVRAFGHTFGPARSRPGDLSTSGPQPRRKT